MITGNPLRGQIEYEPQLAGFPPRAIELRASDGLRLAAWEFHDRPAPLTFVLAHGWAACKEMLDQQIVFCRRQGWDVVAPDLRNHGQSEGRLSSLGYHETKDLQAAVAYVRASGRLAQTIFLWGISMGAVAAIRVAESDPSIAGLVAESAYLSLRHTVRHHARLTFLPLLAQFSFLVVAWARWRTRLDVEALDMERAVARLTAPAVLFVAGAEDRRMPPATAHRLAALCGSPHKGVFIAPRGRHAALFGENMDAYQAEVARFVAEALERRNRPAYPSPGAPNAAQRSAGTTP